jgi:cell division protein FtsB
MTTSLAETRRRWANRLVLSIVPALLIVSIAASATWGDNGLLARQGLQEHLVGANLELAELQRRNQRLIRELRTMDADPLVMQRRIAEDLRWGHQGATIVEFGEARAQR